MRCYWIQRFRNYRNKLARIINLKYKENEEEDKNKGKWIFKILNNNLNLHTMLKIF